MLTSLKNTVVLGCTLALLSVVSAASTGALAIKNGKVAVTSPDGLNDVSHTLKEPTLFPAVSLAAGSVFKLSFTAIDTSSGEGTVPQQAHILFEDARGDQVTLPVNVKATGKAAFTINTAKLSPALQTTASPLHLTLLLSSLSSLEPLLYPLGEVSLPESLLSPPARKRHDLPARAGEPAFQAEQELFHTFKEDEKEIGWFKSILGTTIALAPWLVLLALIANIYPQFNLQTPPTSSYLFIATLAGLEGLIVVYWVGWKLYQFLPPFLALSVVSAYVGKVALGDLREKRIIAGGAP
ncbi:hypothetical protein P7C73_g2841, partial [Tremellales sp. Uapishka_1]